MLLLSYVTYGHTPNVIGKCHNTPQSMSYLQLLENFLTSFRPYELGLLLSQNYQMRRNGGRDLNRPSITIGETKEASNICR